MCRVQGNLSFTVKGMLVVVSQNYPKPYNNFLDCTHTFRGAEGVQRVEIAFMAFRTERKYDFVEIRCSDNSEKKYVDHF